MTSRIESVLAKREIIRSNPIIREFCRMRYLMRSPHEEDSQMLMPVEGDRILVFDRPGAIVSVQLERNLLAISLLEYGVGDLPREYEHCHHRAQPR